MALKVQTQLGFNGGGARAVKRLILHARGESCDKESITS